LGELLQGIGCQRLGQVRALPRTGLQRRGGGLLLLALDRAYGHAPDPQAWYEPPQQFELGCELMHRADDAAMLVFAAQRLVQPLAGWLQRQWLAAARCTLWLLHEGAGRQARPPTPVRLAVGDPTRDAAQLLLLLRERLQRTELPAPVYGLRLQLDEAVALAGHEGRLALVSGAGAGTEEADPQAFRALVDRLTARLGAEQVRKLAPCDDHRPERAFQPVPAQATATVAAVPSGSPAPAALCTRPAWLLPQPLPLAEQAGRPVHGGPLLLRTRAERIESGWFDDELVCRDYHVAEGSDHRLRWVFRQRRMGDADTAGEPAAHWFLHGLFG
ncbi:MAG: DNA polymerase Y family protein, partial [Aquincola tertiaricarbonis]